MSLLDLDGSHIAKLTDADLRMLIVRLCEAELHQRSLSSSAITAGGNQDAADGGVDIRVSLPSATNITGYVPRPKTGFQVKAQDMPRSAIIEEMTFGGSLRPTIRELAEENGAYVIVSGQGSVTDAALKRRIAAMSEAIQSVSLNGNLLLDFYDRERIAAWVRTHPGLIPWVRSRIGDPIAGWKAFANWAHPQGDTSEPYLIDASLRVYDARSERQDRLSVEEALNRVRATLVNPGAAVRLVGLSGTGKTRLVQALFDRQVGTGALDPNLALYTDIAFEPSPRPAEMIDRLNREQRRAIVVVDNCPPDLHRHLVACCGQPRGTTSLITVEYDVSEDEPEGTEVLRLEGASEDLIERLLHVREPAISQLDRRQIAQLSGGNSRIALALARTVGHGESIAALQDEEVFRRLFFQRQAGDDSLLRAAQACSLFYSFDGETLHGETAELPVLATIAGVSVQDIYRSIAELKRRELVQSRSRWRALLPQALALRIARQALQSIPSKTLSDIVLSSPIRLRESFSRRLGYLHDSHVAREIANAWLETNGCLGEFDNLGQVAARMASNLAPLVPTTFLDTLERAMRGINGVAVKDVNNANRQRWISTLAVIAYDQRLFPRAATLLAQFAAVESANFRGLAARDVLRNLSHIYLSGTKASLETRLSVAEALFSSTEPHDTPTAYAMLEGLLETSGFSLAHGAEFGSHIRDFGLRPEGPEIQDWFRFVLQFAKRTAASTTHGQAVREILARSLRGLWTNVGLHDEIERLAKELSRSGFWLEGWLALRSILRLDPKHMSESVRERLRLLEKEVGPKDRLEISRAFLLSQPWTELDIVADGKEETEEANQERAERQTEDLGKEAASNGETLQAIIPLLMTDKAKRAWAFGRGLALGAPDPVATWGVITGHLAKTPQPNVQGLRGFINALSQLNPATAAKLLDAAVEAPETREVFPLLQSAVDIDKSAAERVLRSISFGKARSWMYKGLGWGGVTRHTPSSVLKEIVLGICRLPGGFPVAVDILGMRCHGDDSDSPIDSEIIDAGRRLMNECRFEDHGDMQDYYLAMIARKCLIGKDAKDFACRICGNVAAGILQYRISRYSFGEFTKALFATQPEVALDVLLDGNDLETINKGAEYFGPAKQGPLDSIPSDVVFGWIKQGSSERYVKVAAVVNPLVKENEKLGWSPIARELLNRAPNRSAVLAELTRNLFPRSWSGSLADILESRRVLLVEFFSDNDSQVASQARELDERLKLAAENERLRERREHTSFE